MNKICTSIEQSKKLVELGIDINTADMHYNNLSVTHGSDYVNDFNAELMDYNSAVKLLAKYTRNPLFEIIPCWSLAALLSVLEHPRCFQGDKSTYWFCGCFGKDKLYHEVEADNPVDACVQMILEMHELNLL